MIEKTVLEIAQLLQGRIQGDPTRKVSSFQGIEQANEGDLTFLANPKYAHYLATTKATAVLVREDFQCEEDTEAVLIFVKDPYLSLAQLLQMVEKSQYKKPSGISPLAVISTTATIGEDCYIGPFAVIEDGAAIGEGALIYPHSYVGSHCRIGDGSILYPHVTLYPHTIVGRDCILHAGCCLGADGFGFVPMADKLEKIPQMGNVTIGDNVEIGAGTCIDRSVMGSTNIHNGVKIDNLVQVGHNCSIGENSVISAQTGFAGSTHMGRWCRTGGQVGFAGHLHVGDQCEIGAQSGVIKDLPPGSRVLGSPATKATDSLRSASALRQLPNLLKEVKELKRKTEDLEKLLCNNKH